MDGETMWCAIGAHMMMVAAGVGRWRAWLVARILAVSGPGLPAPYALANESHDVATGMDVALVVNVAARIAAESGALTGVWLVVKAVGETDDGQRWATFRAASGKVTTIRIDRDGLRDGLETLAKFVKAA